MPKKPVENIMTVAAKFVGSAMGTIANKVGVRVETKATESAPPKRANTIAKLPKVRTKSYINKKSAHKRKIAKHTAG
ncbi:MAG: hypothetical protein JWO91_3677 [Acidobacteriaceae bacterium]|jgi:hypothetical protein|nr:hypothetical protein [Acidobacteriaceae bacterium]